MMMMMINNAYSELLLHLSFVGLQTIVVRYLFMYLFPIYDRMTGETNKTLMAWFSDTLLQYVRFHITCSYERQKEELGWEPLGEEGLLNKVREYLKEHPID